MPPASGESASDASAWLAAKLRNYYPQPRAETVRTLARTVAQGVSQESEQPFVNPFHITDLLVFDEGTLREMLEHHAYGLMLDELATALHSAPVAVVEHVRRALPPQQRANLCTRLRQDAAPSEIHDARRRTLDKLFWELTYWKTPHLYDELIEGERLHPAIFTQLAGYIRGHIVLDAGAGSGRATFECLRQGARRVYAIEPSPGLLRILRQKLGHGADARRVALARGRFDALPLRDSSVDIALSCSAFTADPQQGGEPGLAELRRVTRPGGMLVLIWPRPEDYAWLAAHGFAYVALPTEPGMSVRFRSLHVAYQVARRFYAHNRAVLRYLRHHRQPEVPFEVLGYNPPHDYCWLRVEK